MAIGHLAGFIYAPSRAAAELGYYAEAGIEIDLIEFDDTSALLTALLSGDIQGALTGFDRPLTLREEGQDVRSLMAVYQLPIYSVIAQPDLQVAEGDVATVFRDLAGTTFGVPGRGGSSWGVFQALLTEAGMTEQDVEVLESGLGSSLIATAEGGNVDAFLAIEPDTTQFQQMGYQKVLDLNDREAVGDLADLAGLSLVSQESWVSQNRDTARAAVRATVRGQQYLRDDPAAMKMLTELYPDTDQDILEALAESGTPGFRSQITPAITDAWQNALVGADVIEGGHAFEDLVVTELQDEWEND